MKKITIYELLGMIKDGNAPKRILYDNYIWSWTGDDYQTILKDKKEQFLITGMYYTWLTDFLNYPVEILEETPTQEEIKEYTNKFLEAWIPVKKQFGKLFDELVRIGNDFNLEDKLEEEKKIPEKLPIYDCTDAYSKFDINDNRKAINEIIDYLKSKGDE